MKVQRNLLIWVTLAAATPASGQQILGQQIPPTAGLADTEVQGTASIPDFSGVWHHGSLPWLIPPPSGPGPVTNRSRRRDNGVSNYDQLVGDYANPILQPWASEVVKNKGAL
jgi:hypothetical protein